MDYSIYKKLSKEQLEQSFSCMIIDYIKQSMRREISLNDALKIAYKFKIDEDVVIGMINDYNNKTSLLNIDFMTFFHIVLTFVKYYNRRYFRKNDIEKLRKLDLIELNLIYNNYFRK
jgi:hypothetical protein